MVTSHKISLSNALFALMLVSLTGTAGARHHTGSPEAAAAPTAARTAPEGPPPARSSGVIAAPVRTDAAATEPAGHGPSAVESPPPSTTGAHPPTRTVRQSTVIKGRRLTYDVTVGTLPATAGDGTLTGEIFYTAYTLVGPRAPGRPVTFAFNGGPGGASVYLHFGGLGPKRLQFGTADDSPSDLKKLVDNQQTWLTDTDLVFVDPIGTGFSRSKIAGERANRQFYSIEGDATYLAAFIDNWLRSTNRLGSQFYLAGESYGGFRVPKIAMRLASNHGLAPAGLVLISPYLDRSYFSDADASPLPLMKLLPTLYAAKLLREGGQPTDDLLRPAEEYVRGEFLADYLRGSSDREAVNRLVDRVAHFSGLDRRVVERYAGRISAETFRREILASEEKVVSAYDAEVAGTKADPFGDGPANDPILSRVNATVTSAISAYLTNSMGWRSDLPYKSINMDVYASWQWGNGSVVAPPVEVISDLRNLLANDPRLKVIIANGRTDLVTTYFESQLAASRIPAASRAGRLQLKVYRGGHMFYTGEQSRAELLTDVRLMFGWLSTGR